MRVLRVSHSAVVDAWRERERAVARRGVEVRLLSAAAWDEGGSRVPLVPRSGEPVEGVGTLGTHPALFVYDPRPLWRALGEDVGRPRPPRGAVRPGHRRGAAAARAAGAADALPRLLRAEPRQAAPRAVPVAAAAGPRRRRRGERLQHRGRRASCERRGFPGRPDVVPLGVDVAPDRAAGAPARGRTIGYAGRLADHKGVDVLLEAVAGLSDTELVVAGAVRRRPRCTTARRGRTWPDGSASSVRLQDEALAAFYQGLDVLAVPSRTTAGVGRAVRPGRGRGHGRTACRSSPATAAPCPTSSVTPACWSRPDDAVALREALDRMLGDVALRRRSREAGLRIAADCRWEVVADRYVEIYRRVTPSRRDGGAPRPRCRGGRRRLRDARAAPAGPRPPRRTARHGRGQLGLGPGAAGVLRSRGALPRRRAATAGSAAGSTSPSTTGWTRRRTSCSSTRTPWSAPTTSRPCTAPCSRTRRWPRWGPPRSTRRARRPGWAGRSPRRRAPGRRRSVSAGSSATVRTSRSGRCCCCGPRRWPRSAGSTRASSSTRRRPTGPTAPRGWGGATPWSPR